VHSVAVDGVTLEYESRGSGEPVVFIHLSIYADSFAPLMDQPSLARYRLVRYHRRGYAGSTRSAGPATIMDQAADLVGLLDHIGVRRAHIAGHSYGGLIALQLALDRPDLVGSLVLMEPALRVRSGGPASQELSRRMALGFQRYRENDRAGAVDGFLTAVFAPGYRQFLDRVIPGGWEQAVHG
jgi:pimeloyl-ACP methyl ester carboxylesterase